MTTLLHMLLIAGCAAITSLAVMLPWWRYLPRDAKTLTITDSRGRRTKVGEIA